MEDGFMGGSFPTEFSIDLGAPSPLGDLYTKLYTTRPNSPLRLIRSPLKWSRKSGWDVSPWGRQSSKARSSRELRAFEFSATVK